MTQIAEWRKANREWFRIWCNWLFVSLLIRWVEIYFVFFMPSVPMKFLRSACIGLIMGVLQWLVIKKRLGKESKLWIIVTWVGYMITATVAYKAFGVLEQRFFELRPGFSEYDVIVVFFYMYWIVEALAIGILQSLLIRMWTKYNGRWVIIVVISVSIEFLIIYPTGAMAMLLMGFSILGHIIVTLAMFLTSSMTGVILVKLLKTCKTTISVL